MSHVAHKQREEVLKIIFFILLLQQTMIATASLQSSSKYIRSLENYSKYDKRIRPYHGNATLNLTVIIEVVSFGDVDEVESEFSLDVFFYQSWRDPRLRHSENQPIVLTGAHGDLVWRPDTFFINVKRAQLHNVLTDNSRVQITKNGDVQYSTRITMTAGCEMDLHRYPLDTQTCQLRIMSYAYGKHEIDYRWQGNTKSDIVVINDHMAQLVISGVKEIKTASTFGGVMFSELIAEFEFKRRLGYSLLQIYAPTFLIVSLSWLSFWISKNAVPARTAMGITTILTIVTLNGSFRATVPKVSYIKAIDLYLIVSFFFVYGAVIEYIAVLMHSDYMAHSKLEKEKKNDNQTQQETTTERDGSLQNNIGLQMEQKWPASLDSVETVENSVDISTGSNQCSPSRNAKAFVKEIISVNSTPIDKISKIAFPLFYILFNIAYWVFYYI